MGKLYGVALITNAQIRNLTLGSVLGEESFNKNDYVYDGEYDYVIDMNNSLNTSITRYIKVYKTLNGAKRFRDEFKSDSVMRLRYAVSNPNGGWNREYNRPTHQSVIIEITKEWDDIIDKRIEDRTKTYNDDIERLKSKKSK
jgi:hypothetical protein